jgi:hypothetical protein
MRRIFMYGVISFIGCLSIWPQATDRVYKAELVRRIANGNSAGELGYWLGPGTEHAPSFPRIMGDKIFIMDTANGRLNIYDREFGFIEDVRSSDKNVIIGTTRNFTVLPQDDIVGFAFSFFSRIKPDGTEVFRINTREMPKHLSEGIYWIYRDVLIFTARRDGGEYKAVDGQGRFLSTTEIARLGEEMKMESRLRKESARLQEAIDRFLKENKLILQGDVDLLLTKNADLYNNFYRLIRENGDRPFKHQVPDAEYSMIGGGIGTADAEGNTYWYLTNVKAKQKYNYILSPRGEVLDYFNINPKNLPFGYAVDGNFYAIVKEDSDNFFDVYRVRRRW